MFGLQRLRRLKTAATVGLLGTMCQFGGCELGEITTTSTVSVRELLIGVVRAAILTPLDQFVTDSINNAFGDDN